MQRSCKSFALLHSFMDEVFHYDNENLLPRPLGFSFTEFQLTESLVEAIHLVYFT